MDPSGQHAAETPKQIIESLTIAPHARSWWQAIGQLAWFGAAAIPALMEALAADSALVRHIAARALGQIGLPARPATHILLDRLFDADTEVRCAAAWALIQIRPPLRAALPLLIGRLAAEENRAVQRYIIYLLGSIGPAAQAARAHIYPAFDDPYLFPDALYALRSIAPDDAYLLQILADQLTTPGAPFRALAAETVGKLRLRGPI